MLKNIQESTEVWSGLSRLDSGNGGMGNPTQVGELSLGKLEIMALLDHCPYDLGKGFNLIDIFANFRICCPHVIFII
jgi:hypothetical protein